jgi:CubicO group peptidase (beta-lactamase class C family)
MTRSGSTAAAGGPQAPVEDATARRAPPGLAAAVVGAGGAAGLITSGLADIGTLRPVTAQTTFLWFSMTKIVTATAAMMLADRGALDLDAPVIEHVPELRVLRGPGSLITARHLLAHSSGLANPPPIRWVRPAGAPPPDARAFLARLLHRHRRLRSHPGDTAAYSNLGYLVLGELIASCAGQPFCQFVQRELLVPLGMNRTGFEHARAPADIATGYWRLRPGGQTALRLLLPPGIVGQRTDGLVAFRPFYVNGPPYGGLVGDVHDAARFLALHLGGGAARGQRLLSAESTVAMRTLTTKGTKLTTGLGWWRRRRLPKPDPPVPGLRLGSRHVREPHQLPRRAADRRSSHVRNRAAVGPSSAAAADVTFPRRWPSWPSPHHCHGGQREGVFRHQGRKRCGL